MLRPFLSASIAISVFSCFALGQELPQLPRGRDFQKSGFSENELDAIVIEELTEAGFGVDKLEFDHDHCDKDLAWTPFFGSFGGMLAKRAPDHWMVSISEGMRPILPLQSLPNRAGLSRYLVETATQRYLRANSVRDLAKIRRKLESLRRIRCMEALKRSDLH